MSRNSSRTLKESCQFFKETEIAEDTHSGEVSSTEVEELSFILEWVISRADSGFNLVSLVITCFFLQRSHVFRFSTVLGPDFLQDSKIHDHMLHIRQHTHLNEALTKYSRR